MNSDSYVHILAKETERKLAFRGQTGEAFINWQRHLRVKLRELLGLDNISKRKDGSLRCEKVRQFDHQGYLCQDWSLYSEIDFQIRFYILYPEILDKPKPLIITPHGHSKNGRDNYIGIWHSEKEKAEIIDGQRDIALQAVKAGYIAIAPEMRGFGTHRLKKDVENDADFSDRCLQMRALLFGRTMIGERVWDIQRIMDFAQSRPEIDNTRIAITGNSGGGTIALFTAAMDDRISMALPSCCFCTFEDSIGSMFHCECNYIPHIMEFVEMYDIAGLIAPRPLLIVMGKDDYIFPLDSAQKAFEYVHNIYSAAGEPKQCIMYIGNGGHRFYKDGVWEYAATIFG